jgi:hypothetical protein
MNMAFGAPENSPQPTKDVSRRTLMKTAAWTVPVIAFAAPLPSAAASPCTPTTSYDNLQVGSSPTMISFLPDLGVAASIAYSYNPGGLAIGDTGTVAQTSTIPPWRYIELEMLRQGNPARLTAGSYIQVTIALTAPVTGFSLLLHDIDSEEGGYIDSVEVVTAGWVGQRGTNIQGDGTSGNRYRPIAWGDYPISSGDGRLRLTWPGTISAATFRYVAGLTGNSANQHIGLGDLSYSACVPAAGPSARSAARSFSEPRASIGTSDAEAAFEAQDGADS